MLPKFLTWNYPLEKHLFLIPRFALRLIGCYPETALTLPIKLWAIFNFVILIYGNYTELYFGIYNLRIDIASALDAFCPVASSIMCLAKMCAICWYREDFKLLIETVRKISLTQDAKEKIKVKRLYFSLTTRLSAFLLISASLTNITYSLRPIIMNLVRYFNGMSIIHEVPFKMIFPEILLHMPFYPFTFLLTHWHGYITVFLFVGADGFFLAFCVYFAALLKTLSFDLKRVLNKTKENEIYDQLIDIIKRHNEIIGLSARFSRIMSLVTLGHFLTSSAIICMSVMDILFFFGFGSLVYVIYTLAALTQIFMYCIGGTAVSENSREIATIAYCSHWYNHDIKIQKMVLLIIVRAQRNIQIKVPFFAPSLPTLASILRFTGSLLALAQSFV